MSRRARPPPILKSSMMSPADPFAVCPRVYSPHVHFPPTPTLTSIHTTHSSHTYDRTPLTIAQNPCALPDRGERYYDNCDSPMLPPESYLKGSSKGSYFHPHAYEACERERFDSLSSISSPSTVLRVVSISTPSECDDADGGFMTPSDTSFPSPIVAHGVDVRCLVSHPSVTWNGSQEAVDSPSTLLPYVSDLSFTEGGRNQRSSDFSSPSGRSNSVRRRSESKFNSKLSSYGTFAAPSLDGCLGGF